MPKLSTLLNPSRFRERIQHHGFGRLIYKTSAQFGVSSSAGFQLVRASKAAVSPKNVLARRGYRGAANGWSDAMPRDLGYRIYAPGEVPGSVEVAAACAKHAQSIMPQIEALTGETFAVDLLHPDGPVSLDSNHIPSNLDLVPGLLDFALSAPIVDAAIGYLKEMPVLGGLTLYASLPNQTLEGSQLYHCDQVDTRMFKALIAVNDIAVENGPFTFLDAVNTDKVKASKGPLAKRFTDEDIFKVVDESEQIPLKGPAGTTLYIDTHRCLHFGSRGNTKMRILLEVLYQSRFAMESRWQLAQQTYDRKKYAGDRRNALLLGLN